MSAIFPDICPPEIDSEREREIEIEGEWQNGRSSARTYGRYRNVNLTDAELTELQADLPTSYLTYIEKLSAYMASSGKRYKNHAATIRRWAEADGKQSGIPDYSFKEGESL